jgi:hypothetical protein
MLVKFLSYIATIIGNGRWKPILLTFGAILLSVGSISAVAAVLHSGSDTFSSKVAKTEADNNKQSQSGTLQLNDTQKSTKPNTGQGPTPTPTQQGDGNDAKNTVNPPAMFEITPGSTAVSVGGGSTSTTLTLATSEGSKANWAILDNNTPGLTPLLDQPRDNVAGVNIRFRADQSAAPGTYQYTVTAKDTVRNISVTKIITVTVTP